MLRHLLALLTAFHLALAPVTVSALASQPSDWRIDLAAYGVAEALPDGAGYEYLQELAARPDTTVQPIVLLDYAYYDKTTQISPAAMALLSIAVGQFEPRRVFRRLIDISYAAMASASVGGMFPIGSSRRRLLNQSTHSSAAYSTASKLRQGPRRWMTSALNRPLIVSARALS